jgi:hypothetical protein
MQILPTNPLALLGKRFFMAYGMTIPDVFLLVGSKDAEF